MSGGEERLTEVPGQDLFRAANSREIYFCVPLPQQIKISGNLRQLFPRNGIGFEEGPKQVCDFVRIHRSPHSNANASSCAHFGRPLLFDVQLDQNLTCNKWNQ